MFFQVVIALPLLACASDRAPAKVLRPMKTVDLP
jgi:hypothetical protein